MEGFIIFFGAIFASGTCAPLGVIYLIGVAAYKLYQGHQVNNYPLDRVSAVKMAADNCSPAEAQRKLINGDYDKDANHPY